MGYAEEAKIHLAQARKTAGDAPEVVLQIANVEAALAVADAVESLNSTVAYLADAVDELKARLERDDVPTASAAPAAPPTPPGPVNSA